jgi:shikimate dehydrogenase
MRTLLGVSGAVVLFAVLGAVGALQGLAESLAINERYEAVVANAPYLQTGAVRLLGFAIAGSAVLWLTVSGKLARPVATGLLAAVVAEVERATASAVVADIVYVPLETRLLAAARARGLVAVDGLGMLLHQARPGFEAWFGVAPQVDQALRDVVAADIPNRDGA